MGKYEDITKARVIFSIKETETIREIKRKINTHIKKWHPDTSKKSGEESKEKSIDVIKAKEVIMGYLEDYRISFKKDEVQKYLSPRERWMNRFGSDHIWSEG